LQTLRRPRHYRVRQSCVCGTPSARERLHAHRLLPHLSVAMYGPGQRFSQGGRLAPSTDRRLSMSSDSHEEEDDTDIHIYRGSRTLKTIDTPKDCFEYCSLNGGLSAPFLFNWNRVTSQCFCCVSGCTAFMFDPSCDVFKVNVLVTRAPTASPISTLPLSPIQEPTPPPGVRDITVTSLSDVSRPCSQLPL
jgi:hypothetical protein